MWVSPAPTKASVAHLRSSPPGLPRPHTGSSYGCSSAEVSWDQAGWGWEERGIHPLVPSPCSNQDTPTLGGEHLAWLLPPISSPGVRGEGPRGWEGRPGREAPQEASAWS